MRILFVLPYVPSLIRVRPYHFIRELSRHHEVSVLAAGAAEELANVAELRTFCQRVDVVPLILEESLRSCAAAALRGEPLQSAYCRSRELERRLGQLLDGGRFDVVHVEHLRAAYLRALIPPYLPTIYDSVDCISLLLERTLSSSHSPRQRLLAALELRRTRSYETRLLQRFHRVIVTSEVDARALRELAPASDVTVVPNGVDLEYFHPVAGAREPATLVLSGKMSYHANVTATLHFARRILPLVRARHPDVRLRIVGSNPPPAIQALARDPAISATGYLPDIRPSLGSATVAICPVTVKVGIQNKVLEAMAMGLPVVATRQGAEGLGAEPGQDLLVAADSPAEFAEHVCRLLSNAELRERIGYSARRYVEVNHRWDMAVRRIETLYAEGIEHCRRISSPR